MEKACKRSPKLDSYFSTIYSRWAGDLAQGGSLFRLNCAACHNSAGTGGALSYGSDAPNLRHANTVQIAEAIGRGRGGCLRRVRHEPADDTDP